MVQSRWCAKHHPLTNRLINAFNSFQERRASVSLFFMPLLELLAKRNKHTVELKLYTFLRVNVSTRPVILRHPIPCSRVDVAIIKKINSVQQTAGYAPFIEFVIGLSSQTALRNSRFKTSSFLTSVFMPVGEIVVDDNKINPSSLMIK